MFEPTDPFHLYEDGTYQGKMSQTSAFISELVKGQIEIPGIPVCVYRYVGTPEQHKDALGIDKTGKPNTTISMGTFLNIQDTILMENRDRLYNVDSVPILRGVYQISAFELEYARFGTMVSNEMITLEFHVGTMELQLGRRMIEGDVIEMPHLKDVALDGRIQRRFFEVTKTTFSPTGYDPGWAKHVFGVVVRPLKHQQEFIQIMEQRDEYGKTVAEQNSNLPTLLGITEANQTLAGEHAKTTGFDRSLMWIDPANPSRPPDLFSDTITPPDGSIPIGQGNTFPSDVPDGSWFVRTDMYPARLYRLTNSKWRVYSVDHKRTWLPYAWVETARGFMSDRSTADRNRNQELRSIHDVITDREQRSDPTSDESEKKRLGFKD